MAFGRIPIPQIEEVEDEEAAVWATGLRSHPKAVPEVVIQKKPAPSKGAAKVPGKNLEVEKLAPKPAPQPPERPPAFKYQAPIEDPAIVKSVIQRMMKAQMTISNEELCAISNEIRKHYRENTVTKRIPTVETSMISVENDEVVKEALVLIWEGQDELKDHLLTASPIDSLRILDIMVNDTKMVACTLDQGSEIIAMNRNIWQDLGVSLSPEKVLTMESADSNQSVTAGVVENLKFTIGEMDLLMQVHVVDGAPFDILMGRPFFRFTSCHTKDWSDGAQELTLTCPNTKKVLTIPTRIKPPRPSQAIETNPFQVFDIDEGGFA